jgi:O-antigen ligase/tetratricopeptide (TPR) repeat protein
MKSKTPKAPPVNFIYSLILLAYAVVAIYAPRLEAFDSNGPKFLALAIMNLLVFAYFFTRKDLKQNPMATLSFFRSWAGILYALLILISLLSFVKSTNLTESILQFCTAITIFISCYFVALIISSDRRTLEPLAIGMVILLIIDSLAVYYQMGKFLKGEIDNIELIKSVYSNKNVLAAAIFVKLPFALWLFTFDKGWKQKLAMVGWGISFLALFFLSSRAFYLGIFVLSIIYLVSLWVLSNKERQNAYRRKLVIYSVVLFTSLLLFTVVQKNLYTTKSIYNASIVERFSAATPKEYSTGMRLAGWQRSFDVFKKEPLLGCGLGNWKIATLQEENQTRTDFIYQYRAHNDFIEMTTETGIFGGLLFLSLFVLLILPYFKSLFKKEVVAQTLHLQFLPALGLIAFGIDALFNFPHERPEIEVLYALFAGVGIALTQKQAVNQDPAKNENKADKAVGSFLTPLGKRKKLLANNWKGTLLALMLFSIYILILNVQSLKMQKIVSDEISAGKLSLRSETILEGYPWIPNNNIFGEPIAVQKARYLHSEKKYAMVIALLKRENSNPFDSRREYFMASAYLAMGKTDSALIFSKQVMQLKPYLLENISLICSIYERIGKIQETIPLLEKNLSRDKYNKKSWLLITQYLDKSGDLKKAVAYSEDACKYLPSDASILQNREYLNTRLLVYPYNDTYDKAVAGYKAKEYETALHLFSELIDKRVKLPKVFEYRAFCYYFTQQYQSSIQDIDHLFALESRQPNLLNLRGINLQKLGNQAAACSFFKEAMQAGDQEGKTNYNMFCK